MKKKKKINSIQEFLCFKVVLLTHTLQLPTQAHTNMYDGTRFGRHCVIDSTRQIIPKQNVKTELDVSCGSAISKSREISMSDLLMKKQMKGVCQNPMTE
jgi:hypothetical protein